MVGSSVSSPERGNKSPNVTDTEARLNDLIYDSKSKLEQSPKKKTCCSSNDDAACGCGKPYSRGGATYSGQIAREPTFDIPTPSMTSSATVFSLQHHIRVLYAVVTCLALILVSSMIIFYMEISSLRFDLSQKVTLQEMVEMRFPKRQFSSEDLLVPYLTPTLGGEAESIWGENDIHEGSLGSGRSKRHASPSHHEGSGATDDWTWMSSYARIPIVALENFCKESRLYCAANGSTGNSGQPGSKGDAGMKGDKGESPDESKIAQNLANIDSLRGLPGTKGNRGDVGFPGPHGPSGDMGETGQQGVQGQQGELGEKGNQGSLGMTGRPGSKGDRGLRGPVGQRGIGGTPGIPGLQGLPGDKGHSGTMGPRGNRGAKGEIGYCKVKCLESRRTTQAPSTTTPVPTFAARAKDCFIKLMGKPVYIAKLPGRTGAWMRQSGTWSGMPASHKIWTTDRLQGTRVAEFANTDALEVKNVAREHDLRGAPYFGTGHVVYGDSLYYQWANTPKLVRFNLTVSRGAGVKRLTEIDHGIVYKHTDGLRRQGYLYQSKSSFIDFNVDSNGLWIVYNNNKTQKLRIALLDPLTLDVINKIETSIDSGTKGNSFILCGKLYTLNKHDQHSSTLDTVTDIWTNQTKNIHHSFASPYRNTVMLSAVNVFKPAILMSDGGRCLNVPFLLGYN